MMELEDKKDNEDAGRIIKFLLEGDSINVAISKAKLKYSDYTRLRKTYQAFANCVAEFYQFKRPRAL